MRGCEREGVCVRGCERLRERVCERLCVRGCERLRERVCERL